MTGCTLPENNVELGNGRVVFRQWGLEGHHAVPEGGRLWMTLDADLRVIAAMESFKNGHGPLLHVSFSHPDRIPDWDTIRVIKDAFFGDDVAAVMVLPKAAEYVNRHPYTHHLWEDPE